MAMIGSCSDNSTAPVKPNARSAQYIVDSGVGQGGKHFNDNRYFADKVQTEPLRSDGIHDPENPAIKSLQEPGESLSKFPQDRRGAVNWVTTLERGLIQPRETLTGAEGMLIMDMDIMFTNTGSMPWVRFPHIAHTRWLDCSNCHPKIFKPQRGANKIGMDAILAGEFCGRCHDKVAFSLWICERCHSVPHEKSPKQWW
jgi:c(7)-type cytochrome triheme protein